jgi:hypothetical protein
MELSQGNSLCSYLKETKMSFFSFTKTEYRRAEQVLPGGVGNSGMQEKVEKGNRRVTMVLILCRHVSKWKNDAC